MQFVELSFKYLDFLHQYWSIFPLVSLCQSENKLTYIDVFAQMQFSHNPSSQFPAIITWNGLPLPTGNEAVYVNGRQGKQTS